MLGDMPESGDEVELVRAELQRLLQSPSFAASQRLREFLTFVARVRGMHRIQQVLLHHLAPLLVIASYPGTVLREGLPVRARAVLRRVEASLPFRAVYALLLNPTFVTLFFVALILVWLIPDMQTLAMLDWRIYRAMNWSMVLSGLSYWWLVLDHRPKPPGRMRGRHLTLSFFRIQLGAMASSTPG